MPTASNLTLSVAAFLAAGAGSAVVAGRFLRSRNGGKETHPTREWSVKQVENWLRIFGVSEGTVDSFRVEGIDGMSLGRLSDMDIEMLSVSAKDAELISEALRSAEETDDVEGFLKETQSIFSQLAVTQVKSEEERHQELQSILYAFKSFKMLPAEKQGTALLKMSRQVSEACNCSERATVNVSNSLTSSLLPDVNLPIGSVGIVPEAENGLSTIVTLMMRLRNLFACVKEEMKSTEPITNRLDRIREMARELHVIQEGAQQAEDSDLRTTLLSVSSTVEKLLREMLELGKNEKKLSSRENCTTGMTSDVECEQGERVNLASALGKLSKVFQSVRSTEFQNLSSANRQVAVGELLKEVLQTKREVEAIPGEEKEGVLRDLVEPLLGILRNLEHEPGSRNNGFSDEFQEIRGFLIELASVVNSPQFKSRSNDEVRQRVAMHVTEHLSNVEGMLDTLSDEERAGALQLIQAIYLSLKEEDNPQVDSDSSSLAPQTSGESRSPSGDLPKQILADIQGVVKYMQEELPTTVQDAEERKISLHRNLGILSTARNNALTLGVSGRPLVVFIDELVDGLRSTWAGEEVEDVTELLEKENEGAVSKGIETFIIALQEIHECLPECKSIDDIKSLSAAMGRVISAADERDLPWRENSEARNAMISLKEDVDKFLAEHKYEEGGDAEDGDNKKWKHLGVALLAIEKTPPQSLEELLPYYSVLRGACAQADDEEGDKSVNALKSAVLSELRRIYGADGGIPVGGSQGLIDNLNCMSSALCDPRSTFSVMLDNFEGILNAVSTQSIAPAVKESINVIRNQIHLTNRALRAEEDEEEDEDEDEDKSDSDSTSAGDCDEMENGDERDKLSDPDKSEVASDSEPKKSGEENQ